jgi:hypothetical protein
MVSTFQWMGGSVGQCQNQSKHQNNGLKYHSN